MTLFCDHRGVFGEPGKGVHATRVFGMAAVDLLATFFAALLAVVVLWRSSGGGGHVFVWRTGIVFAALMLLGVWMHWLFGVNTALNVALLGKVQCGGGRR